MRGCDVPAAAIYLFGAVKELMCHVLGRDLETDSDRLTDALLDWACHGVLAPRQAGRDRPPAP